MPSIALSVGVLENVRIGVITLRNELESLFAYLDRRLDQSEVPDSPVGFFSAVFSRRADSREMLDNLSLDRVVMC
jgi:hypothetical protein